MRRRDFLAISVAAAACTGARDVEPHTTFPTGARERLSVSTYPFRKLIISRRNVTGRMTLKQFAETVKPKLNVPGIEPWSHHFESTGPDYVRGLGEHFEQAGLHVVNIPVDMPAKLCGTSEERTAALAMYREWVDAAVILKSPSIRVHLPRGENPGSIACSVSALRELAAYGASKNIVINVENDVPTIEQPERIVEIIKAVNSPFLRALPDFCNSMLVHNDHEYNYRAMDMLFPLAFNISHVKDEESGDHGEVYRVDVNRIFGIAGKTGYRGYFSMEWEGQGDDPYEGCRQLIEASLHNLESDVPAR
ncbi:MAG: TIM barrel protein [Acidobacteriaceae bacterium]|nr:TIM barrel protein [Acidobacteriaceae bacterium]